jgi:fucose permease
VDILESVKRKDDRGIARTRRKVHGAMAATMGLTILIFNALNNTSVVDAVYILSSYTCGPMLGMFAFGIFTKKRAIDKYVPLVAVFAPVMCFILQKNSERWFNGYVFSYELLILNALFTFLGLLFLTRKKRWV